MSEPTGNVAINPYKAPDAPLIDRDERAVEALFYVVSPIKFLVLMIGTMGLYAVYWFYKNWSLLNRKHKDYWPVARGIFAIFFTHALFREVDGVLHRQGRLREFSWAPENLASIFVAAALAASVCNRLAGVGIGSPLTNLLPIGLLVPKVWVLYRAQIAINLAEGDVQGTRNRSFTLANVAWLVLGAALWMLVLLGAYFVVTGYVPQ